jgi:mitogen-activated protein kinase kinase
LQTPPTRVGHDDRLDASAFFNSAGSSTPSLGSFKAPQGLRPAPGLPPGARPPQMAPPAGLAGRRVKPGLKLSDLSEGSNGDNTGMSSGPSVPGNTANIPPGKRRLAPPGRLAEAGGGLMSTAFDMHKNIVDPSGKLNFSGKAVLSASGVTFKNGTSFNINMDDLDLLDELGKGAYGTVRKVRHTKTGVEMAMKEIRLELDDSKLNGIIMELDILHRATSSNIVEFYGAFFYESCVYYCMEYMDAGSLENLYDGACSVPEDVLARITGNAVRGLRFLKDELQIMHRDVKPTNILVNKKGEVKLCDFGVSGQLEKSLAKTNIGCQSYMAPERIKGESQNLLGTYTVSSDVWSLGLTIVETTMGTYPYPPETYSNVFAQLQAIVHGDPPQLPASYSDLARDFIAGCLEKIPQKRSTYKQMLEHPWLVQDADRGSEGVDMAGWIKGALERRAARREKDRSEVKVEG